MELPYEVSSIIEKLNKKGYEAFVVGGCVRDWLLGKKPTDFDIATSASPQDVKALFSRTVDTGIKHGTVTILMGNRTVEVTTYRIDGEYKDNRHPENVIFTHDLREDLMRRDFTINAMAYHPELGIVDLFGGREDILNKIIRGVGDPVKRFEEDALRMLRGIRFAAMLGFKIEDNTWNAIFIKSQLIKNISCERIRDEFLKIILAPYPDAIKLLADSRLLYYFSPVLQTYIEGNLKKIIYSINTCKNDLIYRIVAFFMRMEIDDAKEIFLKLRFDNKTITEVITILSYIKKPIPDDLYETRRTLSLIGVDTYIKLLYLKQALYGNNCDKNYSMLESVISSGDCFTLKSLSVNGSDLLKLGFKGVEIGNCLTYLLNYVMHNPDANKKEILLNKIKTPEYTK